MGDEKEFCKLARTVLDDCEDGVTLEHQDGTSISASVAAGHQAANEEEALEFAHELKADIAKGFPAWRGWGIRYQKNL